MRPGETILEIGPGKGALTKELLATEARVIAVEKDPALVAVLRETFKDELALGKLELIERDVRDFAPQSSKLEAMCLRRIFRTTLREKLSGNFWKQRRSRAPWRSSYRKK